MGAGASAETAVSKEEALAAVEAAFTGAAAGAKLPLRAIAAPPATASPRVAPAPPALSPDKPTAKAATKDDWHSFLRAPPDESVARRYAAEHRPVVDVRARLEFALVDRGAMFRIASRFHRAADADGNKGLSPDEFLTLFRAIDPNAPDEIASELYATADTNKSESVDPWELMPSMHLMIAQALSTNVITPALEGAVQGNYDCDIGKMKEALKPVELK